MAATKPMILMLMIASLASGGLAVLLALSIGGSLIMSAPGFVIGAFFAFRYATFDRSKAKQEEHRHSRNRRRH